MSESREEPRYPVSTFMTRQEHEARRERRHPLESIALLAEYNKYTGERYTEEHIPLIIADAATEAGIAPQEIADNPDEWAEEYNCSRWPFPMKARILEAARKHWAPGNHNHGSTWAGEKADAEEFFTEFPELRDIFRQSADETARQWRERTGEKA